MRRQTLFRIIIELLVVATVTLVLGSNALAASKYKTLHIFHGKDGANPAGLVFDIAGNLYGTTGSGGNYNANCYTGSCGVAFQLTPNGDGTWTEHVIYYFYSNSPDGINPDNGLTFDSAGSLYGMTNHGGDYGNGTVFELTPEEGGWTETVLHSFDWPDGANPQGGVIFDGSGNLYGTTAWGCSMGCLFEMTPNGGTWTETVIDSLSYSDGYYPVASMVFDAAGNLYGTTAFGGNDGCSPLGNGCYGLGVVFKLSPNGNGTWTEHVLHTFTGGKDGESPDGPLVFDSAGNLYGTAYAGGSHGYGNVFRLTPNSNGTWTEHVLHQFTGGKDGSMPFGGVVFDTAGNLYGTTTVGGAHGYGVVFELTPKLTGPWKETVLHSFNNTPGAYPWSGVVLDGAGNIYGTAAGDGTKTFGAVFEITP